MKKLGVILSFVVALGSVVLLAEALVDERPLPLTPAPLEGGDTERKPVITITEIPVAAAVVAPETPSQATPPEQALDEAAVIAARAKMNPLTAFSWRP